MDELLYIQKQYEELQEYEALCLRCGACCGIHDSDPCSNLVKDASGSYFCRDYDNRLGIQTTVSGKTFTCVQIRDLLKFDLPYSGCAYGRYPNGFQNPAGEII